VANALAESLSIIKSKEDPNGNIILRNVDLKLIGILLNIADYTWAIDGQLIHKLKLVAYF
jgi:hypothetical protein